MKKTPFEKDIYIISDRVDVLKEAVEDGAAIVQLRDKSGDKQEILRKALEIVAFRQVRPFIFILNDDPELAVKAGADGVHVGQDTSTEETRRKMSPDMILGKTTHNLKQARQAIYDGADYISVGPVHATPTKPGRQAVGLSYVREAAENLNIPFVVIGGIDLTNIDDVLDAGARTVGVVRACGDTRELLARVKGKKIED
ncbi:MAG: thiamine phosphate synthase [Syntrophobacterales bacterium]|jgi:thiamine-phosphate pyrophosphorylase|nr:thiamine phosphate synthase [Syntrophobacterales bacterium]